MGQSATPVQVSTAAYQPQVEVAVTSQVSLPAKEDLKVNRAGLEAIKEYAETKLPTGYQVRKLFSTVAAGTASFVALSGVVMATAYAGLPYLWSLTKDHIVPKLGLGTISLTAAGVAGTYAYSSGKRVIDLPRELAKTTVWCTVGWIAWVSKKVADSVEKSYDDYATALRNKQDRILSAAEHTLKRQYESIGNKLRSAFESFKKDPEQLINFKKQLVVFEQTFSEIRGKLTPLNLPNASIMAILNPIKEVIEDVEKYAETLHKDNPALNLVLLNHATPDECTRLAIPRNLREELEAMVASTPSSFSQGLQLLKGGVVAAATAPLVALASSYAMEKTVEPLTGCISSLNRECLTSNLAPLSLGALSTVALAAWKFRQHHAAWEAAAQQRAETKQEVQASLDRIYQGIVDQVKTLATKDQSSLKVKIGVIKQEFTKFGLSCAVLDQIGK